VVGSEVIARLDKRRREMFAAVLEADRRVDIEAELMPRFAGPKTRVRDFKRRMLADLLGYRMERGERVELGPPLLEMDEAGETVAPVPQWFENLQKVRKAAGEIKDEQLQAEKIARQRERFHNPPPEADPVPDTPGPEEKRRLLEGAEARDAASRLAEQRSKAGMTVEVFIDDTLAQLGRIRLRLLRDLWRDRGGDPSHVWKAVQAGRCKLERLAEHDNELFVFPPSERDNPELAEVVDLRPRTPESEPTLEPEAEPEHYLPNGCLDLGCDCPDCSARAPRYARPYQAGCAADDPTHGDTRPAGRFEDVAARAERGSPRSRARGERRAVHLPLSRPRSRL
jgi:hypothetical protein